MDLFTGKEFILTVYVVLKRHYPGFEELLAQIPDHRGRSTYQVAEILMAGLMMFVFKRGSRNNADMGARGAFEGNYRNLFGMRLPVMDTVDVFLRGLDPGELENLKRTLACNLVRKRVLDKFRFRGSFLVAVDGTGLHSYPYEPFAGCPSKTGKNGKTTWQVYALEAKLVCQAGFSISLATEWLNNSEDVGDKQDCELKAFYRLAGRLKKLYPRLPMILLADSLYPNRTVFEICRGNGWRFIFTFKEGALPSLWEEIESLRHLGENVRHLQSRVGKRHEKKGWLTETSMYVKDIRYREKYAMNFIEYTRFYSSSPGEPERFTHLTDLEVDNLSVWELCSRGRLRWKIENEGFNTQKNHGYNLGHKYSRRHFTAMRNYYELMQIAHLVNQLCERLRKVREAVKSAGTTIKAVTEEIISSMQKETICPQEISAALQRTRQLRY